MSAEPPDPRSPRAEDGPAPSPAPAAATTEAAPLSFATQTPFLDGQPQQRPNIGSMLFLTAFFFFMSSSNNQPQIIVVGPDGQIQPRFTELDRARAQVEEYTGLLHGTMAGNWTEGPTPQVLPSPLLPSVYKHSAVTPGLFFPNITGFHRDGMAHTVDLVQPTQARPHNDEGFFDHVHLPYLNSTGGPAWNGTLAEELKGGWEWALVDKWEMNVKERSILPEQPGSNKTGGVEDEDWSWVKGSFSLHSRTGVDKSLSSPTSVEYAFRGLHHIPNGTYELYAVPDGAYLDLRHIPRLYPQHHNVTRKIIMRELEKELETQEASLLLTDVRVDDLSGPRCPLLIHLALPPVPAGVDMEDVKAYDEELRNPTGLRSSLRRPPSYWDNGGLGGVIIADQCGFAIGLEGGEGMKLEDFWRKTVNYAAFATVSLLLVLFLLVRQMELTRTPSTLAQVSLWSIVLMIFADSFVFSSHVAVGTVSDNKTSLPLLVPGFLSLCTAIVFGPRYAVLLFRVQAPERTAEPAPPAPAPAAETPTIELAEAGGVAGSVAERGLSPLARIRTYFDSHPRIKYVIIGLVFFFAFQLILVPSISPILITALYSFWVPQIWRNAQRRAIGVDRVFILGTSIGRLAIPLYALGCPNNVFFFEGSSWVWGLAMWQAVQVAVLLAQERLGPAFFLPKRFATTAGYNYHPLLPSPSSSDIDGDFTTTPLLNTDERTCSICMEEVDTHPTTTATTSLAAGETLLKGIGDWGSGQQRRTYALAPCGHLFHTSCLAQWLAVKTICPLCKRSLPPL